MAGELSRVDYAVRYGPTKGDRIRLGDTNLIALIERDDTSYGDEVLRGWAKTMRTGIMMSDRAPSASELDVLISNVVVIDPVLGVLKANIGVKDGLIAGVGRAGNPDIVDNPDLLIGSATAPVYGLGYIATPGGIDTHVHLVQPRLIPAASTKHVSSTRRWPRSAAGRSMPITSRASAAATRPTFSPSPVSTT